MDTHEPPIVKPKSFCNLMKRPRASIPIHPYVAEGRPSQLKSSIAKTFWRYYGRAGLARPIERRAAGLAAPPENVPDRLVRMPCGADGGGHGRRILETLIAFPKDRHHLVPGSALGHLERVTVLPEPPRRPPVMMDFIVMPTGCSGTCRAKRQAQVPLRVGQFRHGRTAARSPTFIARWRGPTGMAAVVRPCLGFGGARRADRPAQGRERLALTRGGGECGSPAVAGQPARPPRPLGGHGGGHGGGHVSARASQDACPGGGC